MRQKKNTRYINIFDAAFKINFFDISQEEEREIERSFPIKDSKKIPDLEINFYNIKRNHLSLKKLEGLKNSKSCLFFDKKIISKTGFLTAVYDRSDKKVHSFYERAQFLTTAVLMVIEESLHRLRVQLKGLFLHSAGIVSGNKGYLFVAPSQGGKTTIANLARKAGLKVLSDETVFIRENNNSFYMYRFPLKYGFDKEERFFAADKRHEIKRIFFLKKDKNTFLKKLSLMQSLARGFPEAANFSLYFIPSSELSRYRQYVMSFLEGLHHKVRPVELSFSKRDPVFNMLDLK